MCSSKYILRRVLGESSFAFYRHIIRALTAGYARLSRPDGYVRVIVPNCRRWGDRLNCWANCLVGGNLPSVSICRYTINFDLLLIPIRSFGDSEKWRKWRKGSRLISQKETIPPNDQLVSISLPWSEMSRNMRDSIEKLEKMQIGTSFISQKVRITHLILS